MDIITTIRIHKTMKERLRAFEVHPRETDEQLLERLIIMHEEQLK